MSYRCEPVAREREGLCSSKKCARIINAALMLAQAGLLLNSNLRVPWECPWPQSVGKSPSSLPAQLSMQVNDLHSVLTAFHIQLLLQVGSWPLVGSLAQSTQHPGQHCGIQVGHLHVRAMNYYHDVQGLCLILQMVHTHLIYQETIGVQMLMDIHRTYIL